MKWVRLPASEEPGLEPVTAIPVAAAVAQLDLTNTTAAPHIFTQWFAFSFLVGEVARLNLTTAKLMRRTACALRLQMSRRAIFRLGCRFFSIWAKSIA
ncbi:MAG: hypothetical protein ACJ8G3_13520 [Burkholderiaceae bacterium]